MAALAALPARAQAPVPADPATEAPAPAAETLALPAEPPEQQRSSAASNEPTQLDTVVVTARRKKERLQDVPISMAVLDGEALGAAGLTLATDIQERVPGLVVTAPNARLTSYTIRGLGSSSANDGIESSVGLFLDGVYLGRQGLSMFDLVDLDRVEILRGPQGTLFGKNTTAGAINMVTRAPSDVFDSTIEGSAGNLGSRQLRGTVTGPLAYGELSGRLTGYYSKRDGTIHNVYDGEDLNGRDRWGLRGQLLWTPSEQLSGRFIAEYGHSNENCCAYPLQGPVREAVAERDAYMEYQRVSTNAYDRLIDSDQPTTSTMHQAAASGEFNWTLDERNKLTSIAAYRDWFFVPLNDDGTSLHLASTSTLNHHKQVSEELRVESHFDTFDATAGIYLLHQDFKGEEVVILGDDVGGWVFGGLIRQNVLPFATQSNTGPALYAVIPRRTLDGTRIDTPYTQLSDSLGGFGSISWHLGERFDLTTGLRYTYESKSAVVSRSRSGGDPNATVLSVPTPILSALDQALGTDLSQVGFGGLLDSVAGGPFYRETRYSEGNYSGQAALTYKLTPDVNLYGSVARGYKGGGINLGVTGDTVKPTFKPEEATSFEGGLKGQFFDRRMSASLALYYTQIHNYQALTFDDEQTLLPNPRQTNLLNVGHVRLEGVELEGYGYAFAGMLLRLGVAWSSAVTSDFTNAPDEDTRGNDKDLSGQRLYNAPEWSGTAGAEYGWVFDSGRVAYGGLDYSYRTGYYGTVEHGRASYISSYGIANARLGLRAEGGAWDVSAWVRNFLGRDYLASVYPLYGVGDYGAFAGDPRTFGLTLRANFN